MSKPKKPTDLAYYLTLFTVEGHTTWRAHLGSSKDAFDIEQSKWVKGPKITNRVTMRIDRLTGTFSPQA